MSDQVVDAKRARQILRLQSYAAKRGIPCMVFVNTAHMKEARDNMETGAIMNKVFKAGQSFFVPEQKYRF